MPALPLDSDRLSFLLAADTIEVVPEYSEADSSGNRKRVEGAQARDKDTGDRLWAIYCLTAPEPGERPEMCKVKVVAPVAPVLAAPFTPVRLVNLTGTPYISGNRVAVSYRCTGVDVLVAPGTKPSFGGDKDKAA